MINRVMKVNFSDHRALSHTEKSKRRIKGNQKPPWPYDKMETPTQEPYRRFDMEHFRTEKGLRKTNRVKISVHEIPCFP